jgi:hypothetical protein
MGVRQRIKPKSTSLIFLRLICGVLLLVVGMSCGSTFLSLGLDSDDLTDVIPVLLFAVFLFGFGLYLLVAHLKELLQHDSDYNVYRRSQTTAPAKILNGWIEVKNTEVQTDSGATTEYKHNEYWVTFRFDATECVKHFETTLTRN